MSVQISGVLKDGAGKPVPGCSIRLNAKKTSPTVVVGVISSTVTDANGHYSIEAEPGYYIVSLVREGFPPILAGDIYVAPTDVPDTLNAFLDAPKDADLRPEVMKRFEEMVNRVVDLSGATEKDRERAEQAAQSAARAEEYADNASDYAKNKFTFYKTASDPDGTIAGLAATTDGQSFWVAQGPDALSAAWQYQNKAGVAVLQAKQPGTAAITGTIREFPTLAAAQADADAGNIPVGSTAYYRSPDDSALAVEVINNAGTLTATGRKMPAYSSLRRGNILFDAFNEYSSGNLLFGSWDWYKGAAPTFSITDVNLPLPTPVIQASGVTSFDKYYDVSKLQVKPGDTLAFSVLVWFENAGGKLQIYWLDSA
ncbi:TPA: prophage tail fiber N-terminal domain-containing protein, partial [Klebsiella pneumoniae]